MPVHRPASTPPASPTPPPPWTGTAAEKRFAWADGGLPEDAATITLIKGRSPRPALELIATDRVTPASRCGQVIWTGRPDGSASLASCTSGGG